MSFVGSPRLLSMATRTERMQRVLALLETKDSVHVSELADEFAVSEVTVRNDLSELCATGSRRTRTWRSSRATARTVGTRLRRPATSAGAREASDRCSGCRNGRRWGIGRPRLEHDCLLPRPGTAEEARDRRRDEWPAQRGGARRLARCQRTRDRRDVPLAGDVGCRGSGRRRPAQHPNRQGIRGCQGTQASIAD